MEKTQIITFLIRFVDIFSDVLVYAIVARIILSWFRMGMMQRPGKITMIVHQITDPVINIARKLPHRWGMMDFAPLIALLMIDFGSYLIIMGLYNLY